MSHQRPPNDGSGKEWIAMILAFLSGRKEFFARYLNLLCVQSGLSQKALAKMLSVDTSTVSHWRKSKRLPDLGTAYSICKALKLERCQETVLITALIAAKNADELIEFIHAGASVNEDLDSFAAFVEEIVGPFFRGDAF